MKTKHSKHSNDFEMEYIKVIGQTHLLTKDIPKKTMLQNYIKACDLRVNWGDLDKEKIVAYANMQLYACDYLSIA